MKSFSLAFKFLFIVGGLALSCLFATYLGIRGVSTGEDDLNKLANKIQEQVGKASAAPSADQLKEVASAVNVELAEAKKRAESARSWLMWVFIFGVGSCVGGAVLMVVRMRRSIDHVVGSLAQNSQQLESASGQVSQSSLRLSQATTEQAASIQETAASAQELTGMVQRNMETATRSAAVSGTSLSSAQKGKRVVEEMSGAIAEIDRSNQDIMNQVSESNRQISEITRVIAEIGEKTKVINDIVFQTKLLSFNASVEAARAGEHGRGFAVVAEEVGNLAAMSGNAAKEISAMLASSIEKVETIVNETQSKVGKLVTAGKSKVEVGTRIAQECSDVLDEILDNVGEVTAMSNNIASASEEQATGVQEISRAMTQLESVTQSNASAAEQASGASGSLASQAKALKTVLNELLQTVYGRNFDATSAAPRPPATPPKTGTGSSSGGGSGSIASTAGKWRVPSTSGTAVASAQTALATVTPLKPSTPNARATVTSLAREPDQPKQGLKLANAGEVEIPSEDDPRFKDV